MEEITLKLQALARAKKIPKLIYKQTNQKKVDSLISDLSFK